MLPYVLLTSLLALMAVFAKVGRAHLVPLTVAFCILWIFVGLRHHVGMDWNNYLIMIERANYGSLTDSFDAAEPGFALLLRLSGEMNWGVYGTYFIGTAVFLAGLFRYSSKTPEPWLALLTAMPYLVIVVAMAAARQTIAIGILLWLVADWNRSSLITRILFILFAAAFHTSAIVFLFLVVLDLKMPFIVKVISAALLAGLSLYVVNASGQADYYDRAYVSGQSEVTQSSGALIHVLLNGLPAAIAFGLGRERRDLLIPDQIHRNMALIAVVLIPMALVASTAASRLTLYLFPVSMYFFAALPGTIAATQNQIVIRALSAVLFIVLCAGWLSSGNSAKAYVNYQNMLFVNEYDLELCCRT